jgi:N-acetylneuraminic acid mutarotase
MPRALVVAAVAAVTVAGCSSAGSSNSGPQPSATSASPTPTASGSAGASPAGPATATKLRASVAQWRLPAPRSREVVVPGAAGLVVAGGLDAAQVSTSTVWTISPTTGQVVRTGSLAVAVHDATGALLNRTPFVFAGGNTTTVDDVQQLSASGRMARVVAHLPQPRSDLVAADAEGSAYVLGGFDGTTSLSAVLRTSDGRHFTSIAQLRSTVRYPAVATVVSPHGDRLLVFGGEHDGVPIDDVQSVDVTTGRTTVIGHLPQPLAHEAAVELDGSIWLVGGRSHDVLQRQIWRWDPRTRRVIRAGSLPYAVADAGAASTGSAAYIVGGETPSQTDRVVVLRAARH